MGMIAHPPEDSRMPSKTPQTKTLRLKIDPHHLPVWIWPNPEVAQPKPQEMVRIRRECRSQEEEDVVAMQLQIAAPLDHKLGRNLPHLLRVDD
jgi:hypothetical protein